MKRGSCELLGSLNTVRNDTSEERITRSSQQASRWVLHDFALRCGVSGQVSVNRQMRQTASCSNCLNCHIACPHPFGHAADNHQHKTPRKYVKLADVKNARSSASSEGMTGVLRGHQGSRWCEEVQGPGRSDRVPGSDRHSVLSRAHIGEFTRAWEPIPGFSWPVSISKATHHGS